MPNDFEFLNASGLCACGKPLHYTDEKTERLVRSAMPSNPTVTITGPDGVRYEAQRHYIALHGLRAIDLHQLLRDKFIRLLLVTESQGKEKQ